MSLFTLRDLFGDLIVPFQASPIIREMKPIEILILQICISSDIYVEIKHTLLYIYMLAYICFVRFFSVDFVVIDLDILCMNQAPVHLSM